MKTKSFIIQKILLTSLFMLVMYQLYGQDTLPGYNSSKFRSIEFKTGVSIGNHIRIYKIPVNIVYQQNIKYGLSTILYSEFLSVFFTNSTTKYSEVLMLEAAGIGKTIGRKRFSNGIFLMCGGRFYHTKLTLLNTDFNQNSLTTNKINPELGLLYNLKIGKKRLYFTSQIYFALTPFKNISENRHTLTLGLGYRLL